MYRGGMDDELRKQMEILERSVAELEQASKRALGFVKTIEYMGITFNVSRRFVLADLAPLAFFHLVEHIDESPEQAIMRLYERLSPLLTCRHEWTPLRRASDEHIQRMRNETLDTDTRAHICKRCTAYALGEPLPVVGRSLSATEH